MRTPWAAANFGAVDDSDAADCVAGNVALVILAVDMDRN